MTGRRYGICAGLIIAAGITSGALLAQVPQQIGTWVSVGGTSSPLSNGAAVALSDDRTLIVGGKLADGTLTDAVTIYDPVDNSTTAAGTKPMVNPPQVVGEAPKPAAEDDPFHPKAPDSYNTMSNPSGNSLPQ